jgi:hypothetical protein
LETAQAGLQHGLRAAMPPGLLEGRAVWYGAELRERDDWIYRLTGEDIAEIEEAVHRFQASGADLADISPATFPLTHFEQQLAGILEDLLAGRGFVLMRGFPVGRYPIEQTAIAYMGIGSYFGRPRSQNAKGHLLGHVKDLGVDVTDPNVRYYQTKRKLEYHTDSVDIVGLLCLQRSKSGGESFIASSTTCYNEMLKRRPDLLPLLFDAFPTDRRGEVPEGMQPWFDMPIFHWYAGKLTAIYVRQYIASAQANFPQAKRLNPAHWEALDALDAITNDPAVHLSMDFQRGDMQFLHNHQILHSRSDFENWPDPERHRHLLRLWLCPQRGRPLPPVFAPRYGNVVPGDRGGIVVPGTKLNVPLEAV